MDKSWVTLVLAGVGAVASVVGAAAGVMTWSVHYSRLRAERRQRDDQERDRWSLDVLSGANAGWHAAVLKRSEDSLFSVRLRSVKIDIPAGSLLAPEKRIQMIGYVRREDVDLHSPDLSGVARKLQFEKDLSAESRFVQAGSSERVGLRYSLTRFYVSSPRQTLFSRWHSPRRVTITVEAEEISSQRRSIRTKVISQPIDWTATVLLGLA
jgi:hypothetical protein